MSSSIARSLSFAVLSVVYVFLSTGWVTPLIAGRLWIAGYWAALVPVVVAAVALRTRTSVVLMLYVLLSFVQYIAVTLASHQPLNGYGETVGWYTPLMMIALYGGLVAVVNFIPLTLIYCFVKFVASRYKAYR